MTPHALKKYINFKGLPNKNFRVCGVNDTAWTIFTFENRSYLGAEFKKALARELGAQGVLLYYEKKPKAENLVTLSL
jgi:hypothetical protein